MIHENNLQWSDQYILYEEKNKQKSSIPKAIQKNGKSQMDYKNGALTV